MRVIFVTSDELDDLKAEVEQLKTQMESLRLQTVPSATPEATNEEVQQMSSVIPIDTALAPALTPEPKEESVVTPEQQAAIDAVKKADEEHLRLNTKELPQ